MISFRLNKENPREARAREVLRSWHAKGYSTRHIISEALLRLDDSGSESTTITLNEFNEKLSQVNRLLERIGNGHHVSEFQDNDDYPLPSLTETFIASIKIAAKSGMKLGERGC